MAGAPVELGYMQFYAPEASGTYNAAIYINGEYWCGGSGYGSGWQISDYALDLADRKCFAVSGWVERTS